MPRALEFFAGSGLVSLGLQPEFETAWANDNDPKKEAIYIANHGSKKFVNADIRHIRGVELPTADLSWASFPCQDLSLAGNLGGMVQGTRSGLFWEWVRILWELREAGKLPAVLAVENVLGFIVSENGQHFKEAYKALRELGYRAGGLVVDASLFLPQSRPRAFVVAVRDGVDISDFVQAQPTKPFHPTGLVRTCNTLGDRDWVWWSLPSPSESPLRFADVCEREAECDPPGKTQHLLEMMSARNRARLNHITSSQPFFAGTAYRRTRPAETGAKVQRLEVRFDGIAGCLRTPNGGSSRQTVVLSENGKVRSRLMTARECARLMGAPDTYKLPGTYNDAYRAMGDAVAVPVTTWLTKHLLSPLVERVKASAYNRPAFRPVHLGSFFPAGLHRVGGERNA